MPSQRIANNFIKKYDLEIDSGLSVDKKLDLISQKLESADKSIVNDWNAKLRNYDKRVVKKNAKNDNNKEISKVESAVSKKKATIKKSVKKQKTNVDTPVKAIIRPPVKIKLPIKKPVVLKK